MTNQPNAFIFKYPIANVNRVCICTRRETGWDESSVIALTGNLPELEETIDDDKFHIIYVHIESAGEAATEVKIDYSNSNFLKSDLTTNKKLYQEGKFFETIERGYQHFYGSKPQQ